MTPSDAAARAERDLLAKALCVSFSAIIREADEWRPLADHVLDLTTHEAERAISERDEEWEAIVQVEIMQARAEERERCIGLLQRLGMEWHNALPEDRPTLMGGMNQVAAALRTPPSATP